MSFWKKLLYYLGGVGLGTLVVMFMFSDRDFQCSYFPNDRVLYDLRKKELNISPAMEEQLREQQIDSTDLSMMLLSGRVDFHKSNTREEDTCKTYWVDYLPEKGHQFSAEWMNCDSTAYLLELH